MDNKPPKPAVLRKILTVVSVAIVAAVLLVSALMLVQNARLNQTGGTKATAAVKSALTVQSPDTEMTANTDTTASDVLQGAGSSAGQNSNALPDTSSIAVGALPPGSQRTCNEAKKAAMLTQYEKDKVSEDTYHEKMVTLLRQESVQVQSSELTRHTAELAKLDTNLNRSLVSLYCY